MLETLPSSCLCAGARLGVVGTCEDMCPVEELARRRRIQDVALLERRNPNVADTDTSLAVKKFARNVRPALCCLW